MKKALIFAAGLGTRLRPLTDSMPKALVPVGGVPMLERVILRLGNAGFTDITVNIHHFGQQIIDFLASKHNFGLDIHISDERGELLDTGGGILHARPLLDGPDPVLIHNADILSDIDLAGLYRHHIDRGADATLVVSHRQTSRYLLLERNSHRLRGWINKSTGETRPDGFTPDPLHEEEYAFGGIHVISPARLYSLMESSAWTGRFSIIPFYLNICQRARIEGYPLEGQKWFDIGKIETIGEAEKILHSGNT